MDDGEFVFLLGHSGAGKSTLLKLILREETPTEGRVLVNGQDVARLRRRKIPYPVSYTNLADPAFGLTQEEIVAGLVPENFVGRAPQQVEEFIANVLQPSFDAVSYTQLDVYKRQLQHGQGQARGAGG